MYIGTHTLPPTTVSHQTNTQTTMKLYTDTLSSDVHTLIMTIRHCNILHHTQCNIILNNSYKCPHLRYSNESASRVTRHHNDSCVYYFQEKKRSNNTHQPQGVQNTSPKQKHYQFARRVMESAIPRLSIAPPKDAWSTLSWRHYTTRDPRKRCMKFTILLEWSG